MPRFLRCTALAGAIAVVAPLPVRGQGPSPQRIVLEVGSPEVDGRFYPAHSARNRVYPPGASASTTTWTNELTLGDSAGIPVMRWVTLGTQPNGVTWDLRQTYHAVTLAPIAFSYRNSAGVEKIWRIDGTRVTGHLKLPNQEEAQPIDWTLPRLGFMAAASDLVPPAVRMEAGLEISLPIWNGTEAPPVQHVFRVLGERDVDVEGETVRAWAIEERVEATDELKATWYMAERSPYMVAAEIPGPNGTTRMTGVALD